MHLIKTKQSFHYMVVTLNFKGDCELHDREGRGPLTIY